MIMAFFHNRTVNLLNLHYIIASIAQSGGGVFYVVWLTKSGIGVAGVLLAMAAIFASRLVIRMALLPFAIRIGLRRLVIIGTIAMGLSFVFLAEVRGADASLVRLVLVAAIADTIYWPSYHAYFAALGDADHRGQQIGMREAMTATMASSLRSPPAGCLSRSGRAPRSTQPARSRRLPPFRCYGRRR